MAEKPSQRPPSQIESISGRDAANERLTNREVHGKDASHLQTQSQSPPKEKPDPTNIGTGKEKG